MVAASAEEPRLSGVKRERQRSLLGRGRKRRRRRSLPVHQLLHRHQQRIFHQVAVDRGVEHMDASVVRGGGHQGVGPVEIHPPEGVGVVLQGLVGHAPAVQVEPHHPAVVAANEHVVAGRVDVHARHHLAAGQELLQELLLQQVVDPHVLLGGHEKDGLGRVEGEGGHRLGLPPNHHLAHSLGDLECAGVEDMSYVLSRNRHRMKRKKEGNSDYHRQIMKTALESDNIRSYTRDEMQRSIITFLKSSPGGPSRCKCLRKARPTPNNPPCGASTGS